MGSPDAGVGGSTGDVRDPLHPPNTNHNHMHPPSSTALYQDTTKLSRTDTTDQVVLRDRPAETGRTLDVK